MAHYVIPEDDGSIKLINSPRVLANIDISLNYAWLSYGLGSISWILLFAIFGAWGYPLGFVSFLIFTTIAIFITENEKALRVRKLEADLLKYELPICHALIRRTRTLINETEPTRE